MPAATRICLVALGLAITACAGDSPTALDCSALPSAEQPRSRTACLSDADVLAELASVEGRVSIGFKEAGTTRGVDARGTNLTSAATTSRMVHFLHERGVVIRWQSSSTPAVFGEMPIERQLLRELRTHPNVDYLEPSLPGRFPIQ